jgi:serine/threonine-protein kinase
MEVEAKQQEALRARFQREARATASLRSPNTVELYDFGVREDGSFFYVMEYLTGIDLQRLVEKFGALRPARAIHLLGQACLSLAEAHEAGLVHRDIKPSNLFTCQFGKAYDVVKVLDFGVVRLTEGQDHWATATGQLSGAPASMAPELVEGTQADTTADIYGLGCVAHWLLTGRPVFEAPNLMALLMQHATKAPEPLSTHEPKVPAELDEIVLECLAKSPEDRPGQAMELRERLLAIRLDHSWDEREASTWWAEQLPASQSDGDAKEEDIYGKTVDFSSGAQLDAKQNNA